MFYVFQPSRIWDGASDAPDETQPETRIKAKSEQRARKRLPATSAMGRKWILVRTETNADAA